MKSVATCNSSGSVFLRLHFSILPVVFAGLLLASPALAQSRGAEVLSKAPSRLVSPIDEHVLTTLKRNVRPDLANTPDLGVVEDARQLHLYLLLQRTTAQQADLDNLIQRQQQPAASEYHRWLTPKEFGARFGASPEDIAKISTWLESHGFQIRSVLNNASMIDFAATAGQVREAFHTELHYFDIRGGKYLANVIDPQIPAALAPVVVGIKGLARIPPLMSHTKARQGTFEKETRRWHDVSPTGMDKPKPEYYDGYNFNVTPQDLYTIYDINPVFTGGNLAASATVAVIEESDIEYGTVNSTTGATLGGDVATFRALFGVPGTLNMNVYHGYGSVTCSDPGIDPDNDYEDEEASLDAEWINATAPSANLIFMSCDQSPDNGIFTSMAALIDNNLSDVMSLSYGESELNYVSADYTFQDTLYSQAAAQGQSVFVSAGDSGSDVADQNSYDPATSGINVSAFGSPLVTVAGGTDFQDQYDDFEGGPAQSTYWSSTNSTYYGDAISYVPETSWNDSCASSITAALEGYTGAEFCATGYDTFESVVGGSGGISTHYAVPAWQTGISGYSNSMHAQPDIAGFAAVNDAWNHILIFCDSNPAFGGSYACTSDSTFGEAGGTSFVAPYMAGTIGLLKAATGSRQGVLNPGLYALGKAQYTNQSTECYANGQTSNAGVTTGLPAASCIFNDVTTSNNDVPCAAGATSCYVDASAPYGMLSLTGSSSLSVAYPSTAGFDQVSGIGSVNVANLISKWNTAFTSGTTLSANPTSISSSGSTELKATVAGGTPTGYVDTPPALAGTATFKAGTTVVGSCTLSGGTCSSSVAGTSFQSGANSVTATFSGSGTYPSSVSSIVTVTLSGGGGSTPAALTTPAPGSTFTSTTVTFDWTAPSGATGYLLHLGSTGVGSSNLDSSGKITGNTVTFGSLPANGETIYARLYTYFGTSSVSVDYTYTAITATAATLTTPAPSSTFTSNTVTFGWAAVTGATKYLLELGTTGVGSSNVYTSGGTTGTTATATGLPGIGETVYARLFTYFGTTAVSADFTYTDVTQSTLTTPTPGSTFTSTNVTFDWTAATGATKYLLHLGTTGVGSSNVYSSGGVTGVTATAVNLPGNGETIYVRLYTYYGTAYATTDYTYTDVTQSSLTTPAPSSTFTSTSVTFDWKTATGATKYLLHLGSTGVGSSNLDSSGQIAGTTFTFSSLPSNGETIYARLFTYWGTAYAYSDYTYTALTATAATLNSPTPGSTLVSPSTTFGWTAVTGATKYLLELGTTGVGSSNLYNSGGTTGTTATANNLPGNGETIYARLYTYFGTTSVSADSTYTDVTQSVLTTPTPGTAFTSTSVTFDWTAATGATKYLVHVGSTGVGSSNLDSSGQISGTTVTFTGLPTNGEPIYVRLYTYFGTASAYTDYTYTAQ